MRIDDQNERKFYEIECCKNNWSLKELQRQYDSALYTRLALSRDKAKVIELAEKGLVIEKPKDAIKALIFWNLLDYLSIQIIRKMIWNKS